MAGKARRALCALGGAPDGGLWRELISAGDVAVPRRRCSARARRARPCGRTRSRRSRACARATSGSAPPRARRAARWTSCSPPRRALALGALRELVTFPAVAAALRGRGGVGGVVSALGARGEPGGRAHALYCAAALCAKQPAEFWAALAPGAAAAGGRVSLREVLLQALAGAVAEGAAPAASCDARASASLAIGLLGTLPAPSGAPAAAAAAGGGAVPPFTQSERGALVHATKAIVSMLRSAMRAGADAAAAGVGGGVDAEVVRALGALVAVRDCGGVLLASGGAEACARLMKDTSHRAVAVAMLQAMVAGHAESATRAFFDAGEWGRGGAHARSSWRVCVCVCVCVCVRVCVSAARACVCVHACAVETPPGVRVDLPAALLAAVPCDDVPTLCSDCRACVPRWSGRGRPQAAH